MQPEKHDKSRPPAPPRHAIHRYQVCRFPSTWCYLSLPHAIISTREIFFQPDIEADEEIAAHFFDLEFRFTGAAVAPGDGDDGEGNTSHDGFEGKLDLDVEVRQENGADAIDHRFAVGLEGVGCVAIGADQLQN